jgi:hypothetical protein
MQDARRRLSGRYELGEVIGRGGMGTVYRATDLVLDRTVAVKILPEALAEEDPRHIARFEREARAAASLSNPSVVAIYDTGADEATRFIVMECVTGRSLSQVLRDDAPLEPARAAKIVSRVADALSAAHAAGIVHRDVKPGNVMLRGDGAVKVLDFGLARSLDGSALTQTAAVLGTASYMSPEQALGQRADERSDIYSLGCLLYALLTGRPPFTGEAPAAVLHQHVNSEPRPPSALNRGISPALDAIVMQMLAKSPAERPQDAADVRDRLAPAPTPSAGKAADTSPVTMPTAPVERTSSTRVPGVGAQRGAAAGLAGAALLVIAIVALGSGGGGSGKAGSSAAATASKHTLASTTGRARSRRRTHNTVSRSPAQAAPAKSGAPPQATVAGAAAALTSLLAQDVQSGVIDPRTAQQITGGLGEILNAYPSHPLDARKKALDLSRRLAKLQDQGLIAPPAAAPIDSALATLSSALLRSSPQPAPAREGEGPPGHGGEAPGHAKHHGGKHGQSQGD